MSANMAHVKFLHKFNSSKIWLPRYDQNMSKLSQYDCINKLRNFKLFFRRKATPVKNTENVEGAVRKEDQNAAVMSYATLNDGSAYGMPNHTNIYENIHEDNMYDAPYEETSHRHHYEPTPISRGTMRPMVTINGVAVR